MRIVFIGTVLFSYKALEKIISEGGNVVGVCARADDGTNQDYADLSPLCDGLIPLLITDDVNSEATFTWIADLQPDIIFCFGWSSLIGQKLLDLPPMGIVGFHPAELPMNRGRHPIIWALVLGLQRTASTYFFMDGGADSGPILSQQTVEIFDDEDAASLYTRIVSIALEQIAVFLPQLQQKTFEVRPQNHDSANYWRKRKKSDGKIDFRMSVKAISNLVRALTRPYIGAHVRYRGEDVRIWKVRVCVETTVRLQNLEPGYVLGADSDGSIKVKAHDGIVELVTHDFEQFPKTGEYL